MGVVHQAIILVSLYEYFRIICEIKNPCQPFFFFVFTKKKSQVFAVKKREKVGRSTLQDKLKAPITKSPCAGAFCYRG